MRTRLSILAALAAVLLTGAALWQWETARAGIVVEDRRIGDVPATVYARPGADGPAVVIAHGFSGSRTMMQPFALSLARAGYTAVAIDFPGHGDNRTPMSAEIAELHGATRQLMGTVTDAVGAAARIAGNAAPVAVLGHSMATDIVVRAALENPRIGPVIAVSMYSEAVTATHPRRLLAISGEYEPGLREAALAALRLVDPGADEGDTVESADGTVRRAAVVAPHVEHVGVLFSAESRAAAVAWLDAAHGRTSRAAPVAALGPALLAALSGALLLVWPLSRLLGARAAAPPPPERPLWPALWVPAVAAPVALFWLETEALGMLGMTYLSAHLGLYGLIQLALLWRAGIRPAPDGWRGPALLLVYGLGLFGWIVHRYFTDFVPTPERALAMVWIALGAVPLMLADSLLLKATRVPWWLGLAARIALVASVIAAIALAPETRFVLAFALPVLVLFFLGYGLMARWIGARAPAPTGFGLAQGLMLAYICAAVFPLVG